MRHQKSLILNADFTPLGLISCKKAIKLYIKGLYGYEDGVSVVEFYKDDYVLTTMGHKYRVPAIVNTLTYRKIKNKVSFSRKNIFIRDGFKCAYCGERDNPENLELDHVISRYIWKRKNFTGTPTNWTNIVTSCTSCNRLKGDKELKDSGMRLLKEPLVPNARDFIKGLSPYQSIPKEWELYLPSLYQQLCRIENDNKI